MKLSHLVVLSFATLISVGCATEVTSTPNTNQIVTENKTKSVQKVAAVGNSSSFQTLEHNTQGKLSVSNNNGQNYLQFDKNFKTDNGPDLIVVLYRGDVPSKSIQEKDYVSLASLQKIKGSQSYAVPENINLANFNSVAIWCRKFNVTFGYAELPVSS